MMSEFILSIIASLIGTVISYGAYPYLFSVNREVPVAKRRLMWSCIGYTLFVWFMWQVIYIASGGKTGATGPAILWGTVFYYNAKGRLRGKGLLVESSRNGKAEQKALEPEPEQKASLPGPVEVEPDPTEMEPEKEPEIQRWYTCPKCGQLVKDGEECDCEAVKLALEEERKKQEEQKKQKRQALKKSLPLYVVCAVLLVVVCALGFYSYNLKGKVDELLEKNIELNSKVSELVKKNEELAELNKNLSSKSGSSLEKIIFYVADSKNKKYHVPSCSLVKNISQKDRIDLSNYITLLIQKENGYTPCSQCDPDNYNPGQQASDDYTRRYLEEKFRQGID